eukprot:1192158-Prorocentrum_minimum.AAC.5
MTPSRAEFVSRMQNLEPSEDWDQVGIPPPSRKSPPPGGHFSSACTLAVAVPPLVSTLSLSINCSHTFVRGAAVSMCRASAALGHVASSRARCRNGCAASTPVAIPDRTRNSKALKLRNDGGHSKR